MKNILSIPSFIVLASTLFTSCVVVRPGEIAVKQRVGKLVGTTQEGGAAFYNPLLSKYIKVSSKIVNKKIDLDIPSKEGLTIKAECSILYRVKPDEVKTLISTVGTNFEEDLIAPVFRSALADVSARFMAKDMHTGQRSEIEKEVQTMMMETLDEKGIIIERVLMKRIVLPSTLSNAIEEKLAAEQAAQRMQFVLQKEKQEAERKLIEAEGISKSQKIISEGLTEEVLRFQSIDAFKQLSTSPNAKIIIKGENIPLMFNE